MRNTTMVRNTHLKRFSKRGISAVFTLSPKDIYNNVVEHVIKNLLHPPLFLSASTPIRLLSMYILHLPKSQGHHN